MYVFDILPDTRGQHDTIHSKDDIQECYILKRTGSQDDQERRYEAFKFHFHRTDSRHPQPCYRKQGQVNELGVDQSLGEQLGCQGVQYGEISE